MIIEKKFLSKIKDFGLNSYESKVWVALLSRGVSTAGELSDIANVPRSRSYDVLESLEKKGFVVMKLGKPIKYIAVPPTEVIERVKKRIKQQSDEDQKIIDDLKESQILQELNQLHSTGIETQDPSELTGSVRGRENIYTHLEYQFKIAKESVILATTEDGIIRKSKELIRQIKKASNRDVKITIVAPFSQKNQESKEELSKYATTKNTSNQNSRFCVVDGQQSTVFLTDDKQTHPNYDLAVWMNSKYFADNLLSTV
jgi:HTH-type transcriptional regulator, sugar sensing transcriptional regulator